VDRRSRTRLPRHQGLSTIEPDAATRASATRARPARQHGLVPPKQLPTNSFDWHAWGSSAVPRVVQPVQAGRIRYSALSRARVRQARGPRSKGGRGFLFASQCGPVDHQSQRDPDGEATSADPSDVHTAPRSGSPLWSTEPALRSLDGAGAPRLPTRRQRAVHSVRSPFQRRSLAEPDRGQKTLDIAGTPSPTTPSRRLTGSIAFEGRSRVVRRRTIVKN
jgi:hypothetical protein